MKNHYSSSTSDNSRAVDVFEDKDEVLHIRFWEHEEEVGIIRYENRSTYYIEDAVENWLTFNFERTTVEHYAIQDRAKIKKIFH
jgi:hypothetical protein